MTTGLDTLQRLEITASSADDLVVELTAHAATLRDVTLTLKGRAKHLDLTAVPWQALCQLQTLTLRRFKVAADVLTLPTLQTLHLRECKLRGGDVVRLGRSLVQVELVDCNPDATELQIVSDALQAFVLSQDEDAAECQFAVIELAAPRLTTLHVRSALATRLVCTGALPNLADVQLVAGQYGKLEVDVAGVQPPSPVLGAAAAALLP